MPHNLSSAWSESHTRALNALKRDFISILLAMCGLTDHLKFMLIVVCKVLILRQAASAVLDAQTQNGDELVGEYSFSGQSCLSSANSC